MSIVLEGGKYEFYVDECTGNLLCKRYDQHWRQFIGDKAVYLLYLRARELLLENAALAQREQDTTVALTIEYEAALAVARSLGLSSGSH